MRMWSREVTRAWLLVSLVGCAVAQSLVFRDRDIAGDRSRRQASCSNCVLLTDCPAMLELLRSRTRAGIMAVQRAICGFQGSRSMVCCPSTSPAVAPGAPASPIEPPRRPEQLLPTSCGHSADLNRIFGGQEANLGAYPWVAALGYLRPGNDRVQFHCAGSLINSRYILTAAHCIDTNSLRGRRLVEIRLGDWNLASENDCQEGGGCAPPFRRVFLEDAIVHQTYSRRFQYSDDIALIRLNETLDLLALGPTIHPVCLPPTFAPGITAVGEKILAVGWGMTEAGRLSDTLRQLELPVVEPERCRDVYGVAFGDKQICAGGIQGQDTCSGDSGGPVLKRGPPFLQVGVVSFGLAVCGTNNTPAVYTSVHEYRQWILDNLRP
ncbi:phenoloxidase-activating factor 1 isoform X2 [Hyalella azteca]|uniref:CLIP domain-containing serine protease n=1 Tax=Hyalella azteca TaxID=294128 RepID=A0A8B7PCS2_HYAAZ|nr:phenoloxidase-activating factor 1 isoform X2 [Hyalella azteca]